MPAAELEILGVTDAAAWERWLQDHHATSPGVWLMLAKRRAGMTGVGYADALDAAICFGWIDGQKRGHDERHWLQRFTPRGPRSRWSQINCAKAEALIAAGRMRPSGARQVHAAREDGRWDAAYEPQSTASIPDDFQAALDAHPDARAFFGTLTGSRRYAFLYRLHNVKTPAARVRRIAGYVERLSEGRTLQD